MTSFSLIGYDLPILIYKTIVLDLSVQRLILSYRLNCFQYRFCSA